MNEVEKMYRNANLTNLYCGDDYVAERMLEFECTDGDKEKCKTCDKAKTNYPSFTAEKQIELIEKIGNINIDIDNGCYMSSEILKVEAHCDTFEETLAEFVNNLWQDLKEEERKQIKEILE